MKAILLVLALILSASTLDAQEWTPDQQSLIDHVTACWDTWVEALAEPTPERFFAACATDPRAHWWWTAEGAPHLPFAAAQRNWSVIREVDIDWAGLRPIYVDIFGDVGIIHLYGYWRARTVDGETTTEMKRTEVFQRRDGVWTLIGAQSTPTTPADADPYR